MQRVRDLSPAILMSLFIVAGLLLITAAPVQSAAPAVPAAFTTLCFPFTPNQAGMRETTLYITNGNNTPASVNASFYRQDGSAFNGGATAGLVSGATATFELDKMDWLEQGVLHVVLTVDSPLSAVAHVWDAATGVIGVYSAIPCGSEINSAFGPFAGGNLPGAWSELYLTNSSTQTTTIDAVFVAMSNGSTYTQTGISLPPQARVVLSDATLPPSVTLPPDRYIVRVVTGSSGVEGVLATHDHGVTSLDNALAANVPVLSTVPYPAAAATRNYVPRLYVRQDIEGTTFSTQLLATSFHNGSNAFNMSFYNSDGSPGGTPIVGTLPSAGSSWVLNASTWFDLPNGVYSVVTGSQGAMALQAAVHPDDIEQAGYGVDSLPQLQETTVQVLPGLIRNDSVFSILSAQNVAPMANNITVQLRDRAGTVVQTLAQSVNSGAALTVDLRNVPGLPSPFVGSATVTGSVEVIAQMDIFSQRTDNIALTSIAIGRFSLPWPNQPVELFAIVEPGNAAKPITYTWQVGDLPDIVNVTNNRTDWVTLTWQKSGAKSVRVTATNKRGAVSAETVVFVPAGVEAVAISGPTSALPNQPVQLAATISPTGLAWPITYTWQADGLPDIVHVTDMAQDKATLTWTTPGAKKVKLKAANPIGSATAEYTVTVPAGGVVTTSDPFTLTLEEGAGSGVILSVPAGGASPGYTLTASPISVQQLISVTPPPEGITFPGAAVQIEAFDNAGRPVQGFAFVQPAQLVLRYIDAEAGDSEASLRIFTKQNDQWVDAAETCTPASTYVRRPAQNELEVQICHLSPFVLAESADWLFLPYAQK